MSEPEYTIDVNALRKAKGVSIADLIKRTGAHPSVVTGWNRGAVPQVKWLIPLAKALDTSVEGLLSPVESSNTENKESVTP